MNRTALGTFVLAAALALPAAAVVRADGAPPLDAKIQRRLDALTRQLDGAVKALEKKDPVSAQRSLDSALREWDQLQKGYKDQLPADHPEALLAQDRLESVRKQIAEGVKELAREADRLLGEVDAAIDQGGDPRTMKASFDESGKHWKKVTDFHKGKLPEDDAELVKVREHGRAVQARFAAYFRYLDETRSIDRDLSSAEVSIERGEPKRAGELVAGAEAALAKALATAPVDRTHPTVADYQKRISELRAKLASGAASDAFAAKLRAYALGFGAKSVDPVTSGTTPEKAAALLERFREATKVLEEYRKETIAEKGQDLLDLEQRLAKRLEEFPPSAKKAVDERLAAVETLVTEQEQRKDRILAAADADRSKPPEPLGFGRTQEDVRRDLEAAERVAAALAGVVDEPKARAAAIRARVDALLAADKQIQERRATYVVVKPDAYSGPDAEPLRKLATETVAAAFPGSKLLRLTLVNPGWRKRVELEGSSWVTYEEMWAHAAIEVAKPIAKYGHRFEGDFVLLSYVYVRKDEGREPKARTAEYADLMPRANVGK